MRNRILQISALAAIVAAGVLVPAGATAQQPRAPVSAAVDVAERLEARAAHPSVRTADWLATGDALVEAAALRASGDPRAFDDLIGAAGAYRVAGALTMARRAALEAVRRSVRVHDAARAAHAYLAAATLSFDLRDEEAARTYLERAAHEGDSPRVTASEKRQLLAQLLVAREAGRRD